jgi:predicted ribosome quality control (RQC) complex YloA/Tae2 family protein
VYNVGDRVDAQAAVDDSATLLAELAETTRREESEALIKRLGALLKTELAARSREVGHAAAVLSLRADMFEKKSVPLVYSRLPLDQISNRVINPKTDLLLSHFRLHVAKDMHAYEFPTLSEAAERYYEARRCARELCEQYDILKRRLQVEEKKRRKALQAIERDLSSLGEPDVLKRCGDLLLANLATAHVEGRNAGVIDYYDPEQRLIEIDLGECETLQQAAEAYYERYRKARRAIAALTPRAEHLRSGLDALARLSLDLEADPTPTTITRVAGQTDEILGTEKQAASTTSRPSKKAKEQPAVGRRLVSSDGYEILIGRNDSENDAITFRVARANDVWLHAADYPGSHVVIRNPRKEAVPFRTVIEAAQLAAFYSQARNELKAAVNYTQRRYVTKPPRSKSGLVRLSSFKTVLVEPKRQIGSM